MKWLFIALGCAIIALCGVFIFYLYDGALGPVLVFCSIAAVIWLSLLWWLRDRWRPRPPLSAFNVLDYGADPTGQRDSRRAIQWAIDDAVAYRRLAREVDSVRVTVPLGSYLVSGTILGSGVTLRGERPGGSRLRRRGFFRWCPMPVLFFLIRLKIRIERGISYVTRTHTSAP